MNSALFKCFINELVSYMSGPLLIEYLYTPNGLVEYLYTPNGLVEYLYTPNGPCIAYMIAYPDLT